MKDIPGYEGIYSISEEGKIWSYNSNKFLSPHKSKDGYWRIGLSKNGEKRSYLLHRLIALTFIPNLENKLTVDHVDRNKDNNTVSNLKWATSSEQVMNENTTKCHSKEHMDKMVEAAKVKCSKQIEQRSVNNHNIIVNTYSSADEAIFNIFGEYNLTKRRQIQKCARGETKSAYGYYWKYKD